MTWLHLLLVAIGLTVWFIGYTIITDKHVGMARSYSATYHKWKDVGKPWVFPVFIIGIVLGLWLVTAAPVWNGHWSHGFVWAGGVCVGGIGVAADFRKSERMSRWHNWFSVLGFALVLIGFGLNGNWASLGFFALTVVPLVTIKDFSLRTTVVEAIGIGNCIGAVYALAISAYQSQ